MTKDLFVIAGVDICGRNNAAPHTRSARCHQLFVHHPRRLHAVPAWSARLLEDGSFSQYIINGKIY